MLFFIQRNFGKCTYKHLIYHHLGKIISNWLTNASFSLDDISECIYSTKYLCLRRSVNSKVELDLPWKRKVHYWSQFLIYKVLDIHLSDPTSLYSCGHSLCIYWKNCPSNHTCPNHYVWEPDGTQLRRKNPLSIITPHHYITALHNQCIVFSLI